MKTETVQEVQIATGKVIKAGVEMFSAKIDEETKEVKNKLKDKEAWLKRRKKVRVRKWICACAAFFLLIAGTGAFFLFQYMEASERERIMTRIQHSVYAFFGDTPTPAREHQAEERSDVKIDDFAGKGRTVYFRYVQIDGRQRLVPEELPDIEIMYETDSRDQEDGK